MSRASAGTTGSGSPEKTGIYIGVSAAVIVVLLVIGYLMRRRKMRKQAKWDKEEDADADITMTTLSERAPPPPQQDHPGNDGPTNVTSSSGPLPPNYNAPTSAPVAASGRNDSVSIPIP